MSSLISGCLILVLTLSANVAFAAPAEKFSFGRFGEVIVYRPTVVRHMTLYFSDEKGWSGENESLAHELAERGVLVAGIDLRHYAAELAKPREKCSYLAGEFEDFSHELQKRFSPQRYHLPVLIGTGRSAGLVYGVAAQGSSGTFVGALTLGFNPQWEPLVRLCQSYGLRYATNKNQTVSLRATEQLSTPWIAMQTERTNDPSAEALRAFVKITGTAKAVVVAETQLRTQMLAAVDELALPDQDTKVLADELSDLPLEEVRASGTPTKRLALFLTGDGGWAEIDKGVSAQLAKRGIDVVALSSLQYFWKPRSPDETAKDVARVLRHYLAAWNKSEISIVGYSFGADVAPFVVNRLPKDLQARVVSVNLLGLAETADFEVHVSTWLGVDHHGLATQPEVERLTPSVLCVFGEGEKDSQCPKLTGKNIKLAQIGDGHHFGDRYQELAEKIIALADAR
jgi:type IV secretory pathway VirJ component